ncbi:hypothetical protein FEM03_21745 [Phragmitibacter flavus]|uniref:Uncharacterized protein n=1 Tax=Phragmitibacter flavus TaxID=2576071 RepID=A0A5R8K8K0_9BACT|nr:hypothetical protein [Phragmitibacter flavus]TLD68664.1 hypothetical protein FEM03_21745 [Phragmitibacter flavus]
MSRVSSASLDEAVKHLTLSWQRTKQDWTDVKSLQFEQQFLEKLPALTHQARNYIDEIDALLKKARQDCE